MLFELFMTLLGSFFYFILSVSSYQSQRERYVNISL